jgi:hypothetical protein
MSRLRRHAREWTPFALALFAVCVAWPRPALIFHRHSQGDHTHVHADDVLHEEDREHTPDHGHEHVRTSAHGSAGLHTLADDSLGHFHSQQRFHRLAIVAPPAVLLPRRATCAPVASRSDHCERVSAPGRARSPPGCSA